ncbi:mechanosensitive ion channel domain-containing protein [Flavobacterium sp. ASW18X]|uniref:mechanosensitive ion channel domain-containing protein n=1 Tax=Flavobacterium sp. ASW18X TaxID=2572595 RepID=UPI0010ADBC97|nr:mechanosensitive ion channel domain-containing protein [Flavobacterium sp. ASW18X]TKD66242.1 mechanosensitive ion channel [Flavobacterium sp. ASW18X]
MITLEHLFTQYNNELWGTFIALIIFIFLRFLSIKTVRRIGKISDINQMRTRLVIRYVSFGLFIVLAVALILIWGVNFKEVGIVISSAFAVLGVALFANWSILSNVTAGIILFFYFPYKIGDRIRIQDKDFPEEAVILDIQAFNLILIKEDTGELLTYPNNLILQKGVLLIQKQVATDQDLEQHL